MIVKIVLLLGYLVWMLIRVTLFIKYREITTSTIGADLKRRLFFIAVDLGILGAVVFQLGISDMGKINLMEPYYSCLMFLGFFLFLSGVFLSSWGRIALNKNWITAGITGVSPKSNHQIVTTGPYSLIRHPIYFGSWLMGIGFEFTLVNWLFFLIILFIPFLYFQARFEEKTLKQFLPKYDSYMKRTGMFLPRITHKRSLAKS